MKKIILAAFCIAPVLYSCSNCIKGDGNVISETRNISGFNGISVNGDAEVYINMDSTQGVKVEAETNILPEITTVINNGNLNIGSRKCISPKKPIKIFCSLKDLRDIEINGAGMVESSNVFPSGNGELQLAVDGTGKITLGSIAQKITTTINGEGDVFLKGGTGDHSIKINGSGSIHAYDLSTNTTGVSILGSGNAEVSANKSLEVNISGTGNVIYKGDPEIKHIGTNGQGKVKKF